METSPRKIFISYRRQDHPEFVERIRDWFIQRYGRENVFMDFDNIPPMVKFVDFIHQEVEQSDVMLAIIGPRWIELLREKAVNFEEDYVKIEVALALKLGKPIAPVCIMDAKMPKKSELPAELQTLLEFNAAFLRSGRDFLDNIQSILEAVEGKLRIDTKTGVLNVREEKAMGHVTAEKEPSATYYFKRGLARVPWDYDGMIADYSETIRLDKMHIAAYNNRGLAYYEQGDLDRAFADFTEVLRLEPNDAAAHSNRGMVLTIKGDLDGAIADFDESIRLNPQGAATYNNRSAALYKMGRLDEALEDSNKSIQLDRREPYSYDTRAQIYFTQQKFAEALADFKEANVLSPGTDFILAGLAVTHYKLGQKVEAKRLWNILAKQERRYLDANWFGKELQWTEQLTETARRLIVEL